MKPTIAILCLLMLVFVTGCATDKMTHGIPNFAVVEPGVYRGGQPMTAEGWSYLQSLHVQYVLKLNEVVGGLNDPDCNALNYGMLTYVFPISLRQQIGFDPISKTDVADALKFAETSQPIFIHCEHGQDRTGFIVAEYRLQEGWSKADAQNEMLANGFHKSLAGLWYYWKNDK
jgi:protein tyrosine/serine phosphatase